MYCQGPTLYLHQPSVTTGLEMGNCGFQISSGHRSTETSVKWGLQSYKTERDAEPFLQLIKCTELNPAM